MWNKVLAKPVATALAQREVSLSEVERAELIRYSTMYARVILSALPAFMLQNVFQGFFVTAEKPRLGLYVTLVAGFGNMIFDALFIVGFHWGLMGAALATAFNQLFGGIFPLFYFGRKNDSLLKLCKARFDGKIFLRTCANGFSELIANVSLSVIGFIYNVQLMSIVGIDGVSAYGILQYIGFIFVAVFIGYSVGMAPIVGYHFGARNDKELNNVYRKSLLMIACVSVLMTVVCVVFAKQFASIFVGHNPALLEMTAHGLRVNGLQYLFCGFNIFASAFFTALGSGSISFGLSFPRLFVFQAICVLILPTFWAIDGIWLSLVFAEGIAIFITFAALRIFRKKFHYA